jgi:serine/threonine-protein kinase
MKANIAPTPDREQQLDEAVTEYLRAAHAGHPPEAQEWLSHYPALVEELREFLADYACLERLAGPLRWVAVGPAALGSFGDYELLEEVARGGMGIVFKARQKSLDRVVALKMLRPGSRFSRDAGRSLHAEGEMAAGLEHPRIVPVYEVGQVGRQPFVSMELIEGENLAQRLARWRQDGTEAIVEGVSLLAEVARAVHFAHRRGVLHRDLKPSNVLIDRSGRPFVADFGLARRIEAEVALGEAGAIVGTPLYMAPEQAAGEDRLTTAVDIWGLGAVLYELLTGRPPFVGETPLEVLDRVRRDDPTPPAALNPRLDPRLEAICLRCLEKEPGRRYPSAEALAEALEAWLAAAKAGPPAAGDGGSVSR